MAQAPSCREVATTSQVAFILTANGRVRQVTVADIVADRHNDGVPTGAVRTEKLAARAGAQVMPIRFRCPECQQLMGIARRKAGQLVRCPTCQSQVQVPAEQAVAAPPAPPPPPPFPGPAAGAGPMFERSDFDALLRAPPTGHTAALPAFRPPPLPGAPGGRAAAMVPNVEPVSLPTGPAGGLILSSRQVTFGAALAVVVVAFAFAAGVLVGRYLL